MQDFQAIISNAIPLDMDNVDTDMIIPAQFLTKIEKSGYGKHLFQRLKEQNPKFILNNSKYQFSKILLARANFGCGSSREHAVWALLQSGMKAIIAESFSDIFLNNASKNGLLTISLSPQTINNLMRQAQQETYILSIDLSKQIIVTSANEIFKFEYVSFRKDCLLRGQDDLDYLLEITQ